MSSRLITHADCDNFVPLDVAKGICRLSDEVVLIDSEVCGNFEQIPKCRDCKFFRIDEAELGTCTGREKQYWADGNYRAQLCREFKRI
jgi:4-hydroxyphenylacetate decarboxylase small subunit